MSLPLGDLDPAGSHRDDHLVETRGPWTIETEPPEEHDTRDRVRRLREAGSRQVVVMKPWDVKQPEKTLDDPVFQVEVDHIIVHRARVFKDDRPDGGRAAAIPRAFGRDGEERGACRGLRPGGIGSGSLVECGKDEPSGLGTRSGGDGRWLERLCPHQFQAGCEGVAEVVLGERDPAWEALSRPWRRLIWAFRSSRRSRVPSSSSSTVCLLSASRSVSVDLRLEES